jgi:hypothetical protein
VAKSVFGTKVGPWVLEGDMYVITAYFTDPSTICSNTQKRKYYGDRLLIFDGSTSSTITIPFKEEDLAGTKWVSGRCFPGMGKYQLSTSSWHHGIIMASSLFIQNKKTQQ